MNVIILTPDAVGSTMLQRLITIYMQFHQYNQPVINLHELTNGIVKYYSPDFNREILGKPRDGKWGYFQSLDEIVDILESTDHYKTSRLAQYHIRNRQDPIEQQIPFYRYLDENFFVISCRRSNVFEHALSWGLNKITKKLNVYSAAEKINSFYDIYKNQVELDVISFVATLNHYKQYIEWCDNNFNVASYFNYETDLINIEKYILNLPVFASQDKKISWKDTYDIEFSEWNRCHYYASNIGSLALENKQVFDDIKLLSNNDKSGNSLATANRQIINQLPQDQQIFIKQHAANYSNAQKSIERMRELGILVSTVPIKKQTLIEKKYMIKNFDQLLDFYNIWVSKNPNIADPIPKESLPELIEQEKKIWNTDSKNSIKSNQLLLAQPPID
jgi:hypothetical protein